MENYTICKAQKNDLESVSKLLLQLGYKTDYLSLENMLSKPSNDHDEVYVYVLREKVIAVMSLIFFNYFPSAQKLCRITALVVDEKLRGTGVGSKLINHAKHISLNENCSELEFTTSLKRKQTHKYYEKIGFNKTSYKYVLKLEDDDI